MPNLLVLVLDNPDQCHAILDAWEQAGVTGVTILESTGQARMRKALRDDLPLMPSLRDLLAGTELHHRTLFSIVDDDAVLERAIAATERTIGDLDSHHTGVLFVMPVTRVLGLKRRS
jgi:nitrogen regulatory protein P-II 1